MNTLSALSDLDSMMKTYYEDTLDGVNEKLDKHIKAVGHYSSVLEHYQSLLGVMGKDKDYANMGALLTGAAKTAQNALKASKSTYNMYQSEVAKWQAKLKQPTFGSAEEWNQAHGNLYLAQEKFLHLVLMYQM